jgi:hypothetical protein
MKSFKELLCDYGNDTFYEKYILAHAVEKELLERHNKLVQALQDVVGSWYGGSHSAAVRLAVEALEAVGEDTHVV